MRRILMSAGALLLAIAPAAQAHHVNTAASHATCTAATTAYESFAQANQPITERVYIDSALRVTSTRTFMGSSATFAALYPFLPNGDHVVKVVASWPGQGTEVSSWSQNVSCQTQTVSVPVIVNVPGPTQTVLVQSPPRVLTRTVTRTVRVVVHPKPKARRARRCGRGYHHPAHGSRKHRARCVAVRRPQFTG